MIFSKTYVLSGASDTFSKSFHIAAGIMSTLAILSPALSRMATEPRVFLPRARIWYITKMNIKRSQVTSINTLQVILDQC